MDKIIIKRDGQPPIAFFGELIGMGSNQSHSGPTQNRWTEVKIYRTLGGKYVVSRAHYTCWEGESNQRSAVSRATADEIIAWLKSDCEVNQLGSVSQSAVEKAVKVDPAFAALWIEEVA